MLRRLGVDAAFDRPALARDVGLREGELDDKEVEIDMAHVKQQVSWGTSPEAASPLCSPANVPAMMGTSAPPLTKAPAVGTIAPLFS